MSKKCEKFLKLFAAQRKQRNLALLRRFDAPDPAQDGIGGYVYLLNKAAPIAIDLGNGPIQCCQFGSIQNGLISYRPYRLGGNRGNAFIGGIRIENIKSIKLI